MIFPRTARSASRRCDVSKSTYHIRSTILLSCCIYTNASCPFTDAFFRPPIEQEMARRPAQSVETRGGWKTTLQHVVVGTPAASGGGYADAQGRKITPHVPLKVRIMIPLPCCMYGLVGTAAGRFGNPFGGGCPLSASVP